MNDSELQDKIKTKIALVEHLQTTLSIAQKELFELELELINKTPTIKMKAVMAEAEPEINIDVDDFLWEEEAAVTAPST